MNKYLPLMAAALLMGSVTGPAFADCGADLQAVEPTVSNVSNVAKKEKAQRSLSLALEQSQKGDEKGCKRLVNEAKKVASIK